MEEVANYVQIKYNNDVAKIIRDMMRPSFNYPPRTEGQNILLQDDKDQKKQMRWIYMLKKDYEKVCNKISEFEEKEKREFLIVLT